MKEIFLLWIKKIWIIKWVIWPGWTGKKMRRTGKNMRRTGKNTKWTDRRTIWTDRKLRNHGSTVTTTATRPVSGPSVNRTRWDIWESWTDKSRSSTGKILPGAKWTDKNRSSTGKLLPGAKCTDKNRSPTGKILPRAKWTGRLRTWTGNLSS